MKQKLYEKFGMGIFFLIISLIILIVGIIPNAFRIISRTVSGDYIQTTGVISEVHTKEITATRVEHTVYVTFSTETDTCEAVLDTYVEGMTKGDEIELLYHRNNPEKITLKGNQELQLILFLIICVLFGTIGIVLMKKREKRLGTANVHE